MAIEFRCTKCNKLLRTADDTAGKHAKCPECGEILAIPATSSPTPPPASGGFPPPPPTGPTGGGSPFDAGPQPRYQPDTGNPYQSPSPYAPLPNMPASASIELRPTIIDMGDIFSRTWSIFKEQWGMCLIGWALITVIGLVVSYSLSFGGMFFGRSILHNQSLEILFSNLGSIAGGLFRCWLFLGQTIFFLKIARGQNAEVGDLFSGGPFYVKGLIAVILWGLSYVGGILLFIVPGIIWGLMFSQCYFFVVDRNAEAVPSLSLSKQFMDGNKMTVFLIGLVGGLAGGLLVICTCGLGLLAVGPFFTLLPSVIYLSITGQPTIDQMRAGMGLR